jgi:hypothetical protein
MLLSVPPRNWRARRRHCSTSSRRGTRRWRTCRGRTKTSRPPPNSSRPSVRPLPRTWCPLLLPEAPGNTLARELPAAAAPPPPPPPPAAAAAAAAPALVYLLALLLCLVSLLRPRLLTPTVTEQEELDAASRAVDDAAANPVRSHARRVHTGRAQRAHCLPADDSAFWRACACCQRWSPGTCRDQVVLAPALSGSARVHVRSTRLAPGARKGAVKGPPG